MREVETEKRRSKEKRKEVKGGKKRKRGGKRVREERIDWKRGSV